MQNEKDLIEWALAEARSEGLLGETQEEEPQAQSESKACTDWITTQKPRTISKEEIERMKEEAAYFRQNRVKVLLKTGEMIWTTESDYLKLKEQGKLFV